MSRDGTKHTIIQILPNDGWRLAGIDDENEADPLVLTTFPLWGLIEETITDERGRTESYRFVAALQIGNIASELDYDPSDREGVLGQVPPNASPESIEHWRELARKEVEGNKRRREGEAALMAEKKRSANH